MKTVLLFVFLLLSFNSMAECRGINFSEFEKKSGSIIYDVSNIIVTSKGRTFFHYFPLDKCKSKKTFIINSDKAISYASYNEFQYISYLDRKGIIHSGWVESSRISNSKISKHNKNFVKNDFFIYFNDTKINVGDSYGDISEVFDDFTEIDSGNKFTNVFKTVDGVDYKFYPHDFGFIYIESSNLNYDKLKRDFDDYRITKIVLKDNVGFSSRGIFVGSKMLDVLKVYGTPTSKKNGTFMYSNDNYSISFIGSETVKEIEISINPA